MPSAFGKRVHKIQSAGVSKKRHTTYERDIILPSSFTAQQESTGKISIPRKERDYLASKSSIGKISLDSSMNQDDISDEICDIFKSPMKNKKDF